MRKFILFISLGILLVGAATGMAKSAAKTGVEDASSVSGVNGPATPATDEMGAFPGGVPAATEFFSSRPAKLDKKEKKAVGLSDDFAGRQIDPILGSGGKVIFMHGAVMPTIVSSPMQVCDVELQAGEDVNEIIIGDSARWMIETGKSGTLGAETTHLFIKPIDVGLETNAVVTTSVRTYHLKLVSQRKGHTPYVGFTYMDAHLKQIAENQKKKTKEDKWNSGEFDGKNVDLSKLNFNYDVKGDKTSWQPERIYDDGQQTFIQLPSKAAHGEMPVLLVRKNDKDVLVNYRVKESTMVVDGLFDEIVLVLGVGGDQDEVRIIRKSKS